MPKGTVGLRASGKLTADEYREALEPALKEVRLFAWLMPGELEIYPLEGLEEARTWVAA